MHHPRRFIPLALLALAFMAILLACGGPRPPTWTDGNAYIDITSDATFLFEQDGDTATISAVVRQRSNDEVIDDAVVSFTSEAPGVVTVDASTGLLTARTSEPSSATVVATFGELTPAVATAVVAELAGGAVFVPFEVFIDFDPDTGVVLLERTPLATGLQVGDVLISGDRAGLLERVVAVDVRASSVEVITEPADLTDAFDELDVLAVGAEVEYEAIIDDDSITVLNERGEVVQRSFFGFSCKTEMDQPITVTITGSSITQKITLTPTIAIKITRTGYISATVERFDMFVEGVVRVDARSGSVEFAGGVGGKITCEREFSSFPLAFVPIVGPLGAAPTVTPSVGLELKGEATLGTVTLTGPSLDEGVSSTMGLGYTAQTGFRIISDNQRVGAGLSWPRYDASLAVAFKATVEPFLKGTVNVSGALGPYTFADFGLAEAKVYGGAELEMKMPFDYTDFGYVGPAWKFYVGVYGGLDPLFEKIEDFQKFINRVGIKVAVTGLDPELFKAELPLATSPKPAVTVTPARVDPGQNVGFSVSAAPSGRVEFMTYLLDDDDEPGSGVTVAELQTGAAGVGFTNWEPEEDDTGQYHVRAMSFQGVFGDLGFPYGSEDHASLTIGEGVTLVIEPDEIIGGAVGEEYEFELIARGIPDDVPSVTFDWSFSGGDAGFRDVTVGVDGEARTTISTSYESQGTYTLTATLLEGLEELARATASIEIEGVALTIDPSLISGGEVDDTYTFTFNASGIPTDVTSVTFEWNFASGSPNATGQETVSVSAGLASVTVAHTYTRIGSFGLVVVLRDGAGILAQATGSVTIGETTDREEELTACDVWKAAQSGGYGLTVDVWDISTIPTGAIFDIRYDALSQPDKYVIEYPIGTLVHDTGWRGSSSFDGQPEYPGGVVGPGQGEALGIFTKGTVDDFRVTVYGGEPGTIWYYDIRCRLP